MFDISEPVVFLLGLPQLLAGASDMSAESELTAAANINALAEAALVAESTLTADGVRVTFLSASMSADFSLTITIKVVNAAASIVIGQSDLVATSTNILDATAKPLSGELNMTATLLVVAPVAARPMVASSSLTATVYVPSKYLVLPTIEVAYTDNVLLERYPIDNGQSLLITSNIGTLTMFPAQEEIADADYYFRGGSTNILNDEELAAVEAAGYGEYVVTQ